MKRYTGYRLPSEKGTAEQALVTVHEEGKEPRPLDPRFDLRMHADGFNWSYAGSGPAQLALALACDVLGDEEEAQRVYQSLKFRVIGRLPRDGWSLSEEEIRQHIRDIQKRDEERSL
jgi:hypothetical protein